MADRIKKSGFHFFAFGDLWLPSENVLNRGTGFLYPDEEVTLTIPSTAAKVISVGAYDALTFSYASFSVVSPYSVGRYSTQLVLVIKYRKR